MVFASAYRIYSQMSGRRFDAAIRDAQARGFLSHAPAWSSTFRYLEDPNLTPLLKTLSGQSAAPLRAVETDFAVASIAVMMLVVTPVMMCVLTNLAWLRTFPHLWSYQRA